MFKKIGSIVLSLLLAVLMTFQFTVNALAENIPQYVKALRLSTASTKSEAVSALENEGYIVIDCNLDEGNSYCYLGYKTTRNEDEAITDIRLMNANGGINEKKYRDLMVKWKDGIKESATYLKEACLEVKSNYEKGSPLAQAAVTMLDVFEVDGVKLSDYLFDTSRTESDYQDILLICADNVVSTIYGILNLGTADYGTDNFAQRLSNTKKSLFDYDYIAEQKDNLPYTTYWTDSARIITQLQDFNFDYDEAVLFFEEYKANNDTTSSDAETPTEEEMEEYWVKFVDEKYRDSTVEEENELYKYAQIIGTYEKLKNYESFSSSYTDLADYIYNCGNPWDENGDEGTDNIVYRIYPLVASLTRGQLFTLQYGGVQALVASLDANDSSYYNQICAAVSEIKVKLEENGCERISVFYNVNRDIYNMDVVFTDKATREATASSTYEQLTQVEETDQVRQNLTNVVLICGMVAGSVLAATVLFLGISAAIFGTTMLTLLSTGFIAILSGSVALAMSEMALTASAVVAGVIGATTVIVAIVIVAIIIICIIIAMIKSLFETVTEEDPVYPDMPDILYDIVGNEFTEYRVVSDEDGNPVDINCGGGEQWDCLFYTYADNAGEAIRAGDSAFVFSRDSYVVPEGYIAVKRFGYTSTANLNTFKDSNKPLYLFYTSEEIEEDTGSTYLYDIAILSGESAEEARLGLVDKKYTVIEQNLTPCTGKVTYLGYTTTDNPNSAITDIRIAYGYNYSRILYGETVDDKGSTVSVEYAFVGELGTGASLYYTKKRSNGSPIIADIKITEQLLDADSGYEPVNLFCGGNAFNLIIGSDDYSGVRISNKDKWNKTLYMYFRPTETFDSSGTEYISGFAFSSDYNDIEFAAQCGFKKIEGLEDFNLTNGTHTNNPTYLLYSTTYNPYRAITEIRTYTAQNSCSVLFENLSFGTTGYVACETFAGSYSSNWNGNHYYRILRPSNAYITRTSYEGVTDKEIESEYYAVNNLGNYEEMPAKGLYVAGPSPTAQPLTMLDVCFCTESDVSGRTAFVNDNGETVYCRPVNDLTDCYSTVAENLTFEWDCTEKGPEIGYWYVSKNVTFKNYLRIFYRGTVPTRGKYVSNIYITSVDPAEGSESYAADQAISQLLSMGEGEIYKVNLAQSKSKQSYSLEKVTDGDSYYYKEICKAYSGKASYMIVQYSNSRIDSIRTAVTKWFDSDSATAAEKLSYKNTQYYLAGNLVDGKSGNYVVYTCQNGQLGSAVTDVIIDSEYLTSGCTTVCDYEGNNRIGEDYMIKLRHGSDDSCDIFYTDIVVVSASSRLEAITKLYQSGCDGFIDQDKNNGGGGKYVYVGYKTTTNEDDEDVIRGVKVVLRSDSNAPETFVEDGCTYIKVSDNMNKGIGGDYSYLYITRSGDSNPVTNLTTTTFMASSLAKYKEFKSQDWVVTEDASSNTGADTYQLCYKQRSNDWVISEDGVLYINTVGEMKEYGQKINIWYSKSGSTSVRRTTTIYRPEWYEYGDSITAVSIGSKVTKINVGAFSNCPNIETVSVFNRNCEIVEGAIPTNVVLRGFGQDTAYSYAIAHGIAYDELGYAVLGGTVVIDSGSIFVLLVAGVILASGASAVIIKKKKKNRENR